MTHFIWPPESGQSFPFEVNFFGNRYRGNLAHLIDWHVFTFGASSYEELSLLRAITVELRGKKKRSIAFFDIGANVGHHSLFMSKYVDEVFAFEPFPLLRARLEEKLELNHLTNVRVVPYALGEEDDKRLYYPGGGTNSGAGTFLPEEGRNYGSPVEIETRLGDRLFSEMNIPAIDLMKVDVEGYEPLVFRGLAGRLKRDRPPILMELSERSRAGFGSEKEFRRTFWEGAIFAEVNCRRTGLPHELRPFDYKTSGECLVVPPELAEFVSRQMSR